MAVSYNGKHKCSPAICPPQGDWIRLDPFFQFGLSVKYFDFIWG